MTKSKHSLSDFSYSHNIYYDNIGILLRHSPNKVTFNLIDIVNMMDEMTERCHSLHNIVHINNYTTIRVILSTFRFGRGGNFYNFTKSLHCQLRLNKETLRDNVC